MKAILKSRLFWASNLLIAVSVTWLVPFICILKYGTHTVQEPNIFILVGEIIMFGGFVLFGISNLVILFKGR